jgi:hypothetical protein
VDRDLRERVIANVIHRFENVRVVHEHVVIVVPEHEWAGRKTPCLTRRCHDAGEVALSGKLSRYILFQ